MAAAPALKLAMADGCFATLPTHFVPRASSHSLITFRTKPTSSLRLSCASSSLSFTAFGFSLTKKKIPLVVSLVARTSDWARQDEEEEEAEESGAGEGEEDFEWEGENKGFGLLDGEGPEDGFSEWEGENQDGVEGVGEVIAEGDSPVNEEDLEGIGDEAFPEPPEEAKLFVGNLPYDVDSEKLAHLFEKAGIVEVAEVIYSRETGQSRGFGFVNMSSIEEAEKAVEMFHRYDCNGRLLSVNKATPRGSVPERSREFEPSPVRIYVGNLPWQVDDARLEQVFSKHGKVVNARVVYDRETGRSRGFGFVTMASKSEHEEAIEALDGQTLDGRSIKVNVAEERPRRGSF